MSVLNFKDGELSGDFLSYHANGNLQVKGQYVAGVKVGLFQEYYSANQKLSEITYNESGELHGTIKYWKSNGEITQILTMENGYLNEEKSESKIHEFAPYGAKRNITKYDNGQLRTVWYTTVDNVSGYHDNYVGSLTDIGEMGLKTNERSFSDKFPKNVPYSNYSLDGTSTLWYENGMKKYEGSYRTKNKRDGAAYPATPLWSASNPVGEHIWYYKDGSIQQIQNYKDAKLDGKWTRFYETGIKQAIINYKSKFAKNVHNSNYSLDGTSTLWYESGIKEYEGSYRTKNKRDGRIYPAYPLWQASNQAGKGTWFHKNGVINAIGHYKNNNGNGLRTIFHENGQKKAELTYRHIGNNTSGQNYSLDGPSTLWYENGMKEYEGSYRTKSERDGITYPAYPLWQNSNPVGKHTWWQKNGSLKDTKDYKKGQ
jgi:antitoxin component YwqK of YwqJK toxin-antitoxin module